MNESSVLSASKAAKLGIPDHALLWSPGGSLPEGGFYLSPEAAESARRDRLMVGDEINDPNVGRGIIIHIGKQGTVATKMFRRN